MRGDRDRADRPRLPWGVVEGHPRRHLRQVHREQRRREVGRDALVERGDGRGRSPDVQLGVGRPDRPEHAEALEVVDVQVREQQVDPGHVLAQQLGRRAVAPRCRRRARSLRPRRPAPRRTTCCRRTGSSRGRARRSTRGTPRCGLHQRSPVGVSQKIAIAPRHSSSWAKSGNAVTSMRRSVPSTLLIRSMR